MRKALTYVLVLAILVGSWPWVSAVQAHENGAALQPGISIEVGVAGGGYQLLDYAVVGTVVPAIRISGSLPAGFRVFSGRPDGRAGVNGGPNGYGKEQTAALVQTAPGVFELSEPLLAGRNTVSVTDSALNLLAGATMLNYTNAFEDLNGNGALDGNEDFDGDGLLDPGEDSNGNEFLDYNEDINGNGVLTINEDFDADGALGLEEDFDSDGALSPFSIGVAPDIPSGPSDFGQLATGTPYSLRAIHLDFVAGADDIAISIFLRDRGLRPLGLLPDNSFTTRNKLVTVEVPSGAQALALVQLLNGLSPGGYLFFPPESALPVAPPLDVAALILVQQAPDVVGENIPARLIAGAAAPPSAGNAGDAYNRTTGGFDNDDDSGAPNDFDELNIFWHHFLMNTFAAHRLVDKLVEGVPAPRRPGVAQIDSGLGGVNPMGAYVNPGDIPLARIFKPTLCNRVPCQEVLLNQIPDTVGHGNEVAHLLAGQGNQVLGMGKDVRIRPMVYLNRALDAARALVVAATDTRDVRVILLEAQIPAPLDLNDNGTIDNVAVPVPTPGGVVMVNEQANAIQILNNEQRSWERGINAVRSNRNRNTIVVLPAGNHNVPTDFTLLSGGRPDLGLRRLFDVPVRGTRAGGTRNALLVGVGNTTLEHVPAGREERAESSNHGDRISVTAPGDEVPSLAPNQQYGLFGGTSGAGPEVAGLAGELLFLSQNAPPVPLYSAVQIIELIEATAEDLGATAFPFVNDDAGNGPDEHFGFGRISAWKAILSAVNRGLAQESAVPDTFPSLARINEANTQWYGFQLITSVKGASVWIDGQQLQDNVNLPDPDAAAAAGTTQQIKAYKGVRADPPMQQGVKKDQNDNIPDEDPTSGLVPVGNDGGEYLITFSIERGDLLNNGQPRTLSLRRPGQTVRDAPFFNLKLELGKLRAGTIPGVVFDDFVFEITPSDFGDAPLDYPVVLSDDGARHLNTNLEWLGRFDQPNYRSVSPEPDAQDRRAQDAGQPDASIDPDGVQNVDPAKGPDLDRFDDGVTFFPQTYKPNAQGKVEFSICVADRVSDRYDDDPDKSLFVNGWIDWNTDNTWEEANDEHVVSVRIDPSANWAVVDNMNVTRKAVSASQRCALFEATFGVAAAIGTEKLWSRFRLDYGENVGENDPRPVFHSDPSLRGVRGAARFGEVEDYLIGMDYGDAPDPNYPSLKESNGARHLDINREWLGAAGIDAAVTRETDACDDTTAEQDRDGGNPLPNLGADCKDKNRDGRDDGVVVPATVQPGQNLNITIDVAARVAGFGYTNRGPGNETSVGVQTLKANCTLGAIANAGATPELHRDRSRYAAWDSTRRLYLNVWADWNANGAWEDGERVISGPLDPEDWGGDGQYTLGEPFTDSDGNGVWTNGEPFTDVAGRGSRRLTCPVRVPNDVQAGKTYFWRIRLSYGEDRATNANVIAHVAEDDRALDNTRGGALWGEVEDYPQEANTPTPTPTRTPTPSPCVPTPTATYTPTPSGTYTPTPTPTTATPTRTPGTATPTPTLPRATAVTRTTIAVTRTAIIDSRLLITPIATREATIVLPTGGPTGTPAVTNTATPTATPTGTATPTPTGTPTPSPTPTCTPTPTPPTITATATNTTTPSPCPPTATPTLLPATPVPTATAVFDARLPITAIATDEATVIPLTATPTCTPTATAISKLTPTTDSTAVPANSSLSEILDGALKSLVEGMNSLMAGTI